MRKFMLFLFLVFIRPQHSPAQIDNIQPPEKDIIFITKVLDSLSYFIQTGKALLVDQSDCKLPGHRGYRWPDGLLQVNFSKIAIELSGSRRQDYILIYACIQASGEIYHTTGDYVSMKQLMFKALDLSIRNGFTFEELHMVRQQLNHISFLQGDYASAMKNSVEGLAKAEKIGDQWAMAHYNNVLGYIMLKQKNFESAEKYYLAELDLARQINDIKEEAKALHNLADIYIAENKPLKAKPFILDALSIYQSKQESAPEFFTSIDIAFSYNKLSTVYKLTRNDKEALQYILQAIQLSRWPRPRKDFRGNLYDVAAYFTNAAEIYNRLQKPDSAIFYLRTGLFLADSIKHSEDRRNVYEQFSISFAQKKQFDSAWIFQQKYRMLNDSILDVSAKQSIAFTQSQFDTEKKDQQIKDQQAKLKRQSLIRNIIIGSALVLLLIGFLSYNGYRLKQKNKFQQQLNKQQIELMNTVIAVQDKERKRIAEDLHDSLGSILSAAKLKLSAVPGNTNGSGQNSYEDTMNLLDDAVNEMRSISHNLLPASLLRLGLIAGLQNLLDKISSRAGLTINFIAHGFKKRIDENIEVSIYRIVLEAVNNIVKHAHAKNVTVQLMQYDTYINVLIEDDGIGFDKNMILKEQGIGLNNIYSRVDYMKGKVDIDTKPKAGTVINIDIPYHLG